MESCPETESTRSIHQKGNTVDMPPGPRLKRDPKIIPLMLPREITVPAITSTELKSSVHTSSSHQSRGICSFGNDAWRSCVGQALAERSTPSSEYNVVIGVFTFPDQLAWLAGAVGLPSQNGVEWTGMLPDQSQLANLFRGWFGAVVMNNGYEQARNFAKHMVDENINNILRKRTVTSLNPRKRRWEQIQSMSSQPRTQGGYLARVETSHPEDTVQEGNGIGATAVNHASQIHLDGAGEVESSRPTKRMKRSKNGKYYHY